MNRCEKFLRQLLKRCRIHWSKVRGGHEVPGAGGDMPAAIQLSTFLGLFTPPWQLASVQTSPSSRSAAGPACSGGSWGRACLPGRAAGPCRPGRRREMNARRGRQGQRRSARLGGGSVWLGQRQPPRPRHNLLPLARQQALAPAAQVHGEADVLHGRIVAVRCRSRHRGLYGVLNTVF